MKYEIFRQNLAYIILLFTAMSIMVETSQQYGGFLGNPQKKIGIFLSGPAKRPFFETLKKSGGGGEVRP